MHAIVSDELVLEFMLDGLQNNKDIVMAAVRSDPSSIQWAACDDPEIAALRMAKDCITCLRTATDRITVSPPSKDSAIVSGVELPQPWHGHCSSQARAMAIQHRQDGRQ